MWPKRAADYAIPSGTEDKKEWSCTSTPHMPPQNLQRQLYLCTFEYFTNLVIRRENKRFWTAQHKEFLQLNLPLIFMLVKFWFITVIPKYLNCATFLHDLMTIFCVSIFSYIHCTRHAHTVFSIFTCTPSQQLIEFLCFSSYKFRFFQ
jgi:hypothetical protein